MGHLAFGFRCCPRGPTYQGSAPQTEGACGNTQARGGHPSPAAASKVVLTSDHKGGTGECWWEGHSPGWALTSHSLSAQGAWTSLTVVFTVLNEGQLRRTAAILRVAWVRSIQLCSLRDHLLHGAGAGGLWAQTSGRGEKQEARGEIQGSQRAASMSRRTVSFALKDGPQGLHTVARTPLLKPQVTKQGTRWAWQENVTWGFGGLWANPRAGEAQAVC